MNKRFIVICAVFFLVILLIGLIAYSSGGDFFDGFADGELANGGCNHTFGEWTETKKATCIVQGERQRKCLQCDQTETQSIESTTHEYINAGSITECGSTTTFSAQICVNCGHTKSTTESNNVVHPHSFVRREPQASTCDQEGITIWFECQNCGYDIMETVAALGHIIGREIYSSGDAGYHYRLCQRNGCNQRFRRRQKKIIRFYQSAR